MNIFKSTYKMPGDIIISVRYGEYSIARKACGKVWEDIKELDIKIDCHQSKNHVFFIDLIDTRNIDFIIKEIEIEFNRIKEDRK